MTESLNSLPDGWEEKTLGEVSTKIGSGATPKGGKKSYKKEGITLIRSLNVYDIDFKEKNLAFIDEEQARKLSNVVVEEGDVLLNITGASVARCCVAPSEHLPARVNQHVSIIRPKKTEILSEFLNYLLVSKIYKDLLLGIGEEGGATRQAITKSQIQNFKIYYPSIDRQTDIVQKLNEAFEGIATATAQAEKNLQNARELFQSVLQSTFSQKGDDWVETTLGDACKKFQYGTSSKSLKEGDVPVLRMGNIQDGVIDWNDLKYCSDPPEISKYLLRKNDVLFNRTNSSVHVGKAGLYDGERPAIHAGYLIRVQGDSTLLNPHFLNYYLNCQSTREYGFSVMSKSVNQANINASKLKQYRICLPSIKTQEQLVQKLDALSEETKRLEAIYQRKLDALAELKQSLLQRAFTGQL
jgi:type I restriction enzyme, S subunit